ncbi:MAG: glycosidase [Melioribacteraceae bacterium]|nr:glycosidase [Melioribacteraceae bacterium]
MKNNPTIYEINTRVWIKRFSSNNGNLKLDQVPEIFWKNLADKGIDYVWLMGIWQNCSGSIEKYCFEDYLIKEYKSALKDFKHEDVIGSPYAINNYKINPDLGDLETIKRLRTILKKYDIKLILDFIPNHFNAESELIETNPEIFLNADESYHTDDSYTFYIPYNNKEVILAHGRDPFFPAWEDTAQVNYFSNAAREFMIGNLIDIAEICDGVRCDMAMLALNNIFKNTWGGVLKKMDYAKPETEFWAVAIQLVKNEFPEFLFIGEAYWDLEWNLQQLGFDFTYDKRLTDRLKSGNVRGISEHLTADSLFQTKSLRFIENHDEQRIAKELGKEASQASAVIMSTIQGMRFYHEGQFEGKRIKLPVQLGREPVEPPQPCFVNFYNKLFSITKHELFNNGIWKQLKSEAVGSSDSTFQNILCWQINYKDEIRVVIINYSQEESRGRIRLDVKGDNEIQLFDMLNDQLYIREALEVREDGLYIELQPFHSHIFSL